MVVKKEKISYVRAEISKTLYDEINRAKDNLNSVERQLCMGKKKRTWSFKETSDEIAKYLKSKRIERKSSNNDSLF